MHSRLTPARRLCATALAGLLALYACLSVVHGAEHEHRYCAEHEAFEELVPSDELAGKSGFDREEADEPHQRCVLAQCVERQGIATLAPSTPLAPVVHSTAPPPPPRPAQSPLSPLAVAPKSSPPAQARVCLHSDPCWS